MNRGYFPAPSVLHRTDALCKLLCLLLLILAILFCGSPWGYALILAVVLTAMLLSRTGAGALGGLTKSWSFFLVIFLMNLLFTPSEAPLWQGWILQISAEGARQGAEMVLRILPLLILGNLLTATTTPLALTKGLESLLYPFKFLGLPVQEIAMILGVALQFIPTLSQEAETLRMAQMARGARFESKKLHERAALLPLAVPLFLSAFRRADELSVAMEARGYRRTQKALRPVKRHFTAKEGLSLLFCSIVFILEILL